MIDTATMETILGALAEICAALLLIYWLYRYFAEAAGKNGRLLRGAREHDAGGFKRAMLCALPPFLLSRALFVAAGYVPALFEGSGSGFLSELYDRLVHWDAYHYIGLIENWYQNTGDAMYHIVFYPLYPAVCRLLYFAGIPARAAALGVSNVSFLLSGCLLYGLCGRDMGRECARRCVWLLYFSPLSFFCSLPFTEGLFLFVSLAAVYAARRDRFAFAVLLGALSALTRSLGILTAVPVYWEMLRHEREKGRFGAKTIALSVIRVLPVALGLGAYLMLNYEVTGDFFRFMTYQREHWGQTFGSIANTVHYTLRYAVSFSDEGYRLFVFIPQLIACFAALAIMLASCRRLHPGDTGYSILYFAFSMAPTWLLSGSRYLCLLWPLYTALASLTKKKAAFACVLALEIAGMAYMSWGYLVRGSVI